MPGRFDAQARVDAVARQICHDLVDVIRDHEPGTRAGVDPEHLHKMRVGTRRLRTALATFSDCFSQRDRQSLHRELGWLASVLGEVRDIDVHLMHLDNWRKQLGPEPNLGWVQLERHLEAQRAQARQRMVRALESVRYKRLIVRSDRVSSYRRKRALPHPSARPIVLLAYEVLDKRARRFRQAARECLRTRTPVAVHRLRIAGKRLRYAGEFFRPMFGDAFAGRIQRLERFQDCLGAFQDMVVLGRLAAALSDEALVARRLDGPYIYVLGQLAGYSTMAATLAVRTAESALEQLGGSSFGREITAIAWRRAKPLRLEPTTARSQL